MATAPNSSDCVGYWKFESDADSEVGGFIGDVDGATQATGIIGNGYVFDGINDYINTNALSCLTATDTEVTFCIWVNDIYPSHTTNDPQYYFRYRGTHGIFDLGELNNGDNNVVARLSDGSYRTVTTGETLPSGWNFICVVAKTNTYLKLYLNGVLIQTNNAIGSFVNVPDKGFFVGRNTDATVNYFKGSLDELSVFNVELTQDNIEYLYNEGAPTSAQQYPFSGTPTDYGVLKRYNGSTFTSVPKSARKYYNGSSFVAKPMKAYDSTFKEIGE